MGQKDEFELSMMKSVKLMEPKELLDYIEKRFQDEVGYKLATDREKEISILNKLKKVYGEDAGNIVKLFFDKHHGVLTDSAGRKQTFKMAWLSSGYKWWLDELYDRVQKEKKLERDQLYSSVTGTDKDDVQMGKSQSARNHGFLGLEDILGRS